MDEVALRSEIRALVLETLMLSTPADDLTDERPLFGPEGLGLDSVDALQLVVAIDKKYGLKMTDQEVARATLRSVATISEAVARNRRPT
ncbi:MAG: acyl carrier protein [Verrucomicrobia bacterium]|nr:acyl carrier protein [Verrucomicrobiota bacterium]